MKYSRKTLQALFAGILGTTLQWYDFALFGYFAVIISKTFFPSENNVAGLLSTFGVFAVGYLLAPIGSIIFGYIADRYGRKKALTMSILGMAIPTACIGIIPSFETIGIAAAFLITFLRVTQGIVASSEFTSSAIFLVEHAPENKKAFFGCLTSTAYSSGMILAGVAASFLTSSSMPEWAWRIGFVITIFGGLLVFYLRKSVNESPEFEDIRDNLKPKIPLMNAIRQSPVKMLCIVGISWMVGIITFGTYFYLASYLHIYIGLSISQATLIVTVALVVDAALEPFIAKVSDKKGMVNISQIGMLGIIFFSIPLFLLIETGIYSHILLGMIGFSVLIAITYAPLNAYMVSLFPKEHRASGFGFAFNFGISIFGGTTPLFMAWLSHYNQSIYPAAYYIFGAVVGMVSIGVCEAQRRTSITPIRI